MFRSIRFRRTAVGFLVSSLLVTFACQGDDAPGIVKAPGPAPSPDIVDDDGTTKGYMYFAGNAYNANNKQIATDALQVIVDMMWCSAKAYEAAEKAGPHHEDHEVLSSLVARRRRRRTWRDRSGHQHGMGRQ